MQRYDAAHFSPLNKYFEMHKMNHFHCLEKFDLHPRKAVLLYTCVCLKSYCCFYSTVRLPENIPKKEFTTDRLILAIHWK